MNTITRKHPLALASLILGLLSIFLWEMSAIPASALVTGILGAVYASEKGTGRWFAVIGAILGLVFIAVLLRSKLDLGF